MSGVVSALAALGPIAKTIDTIAGLFGRQRQQAAEADLRTAGATMAAAETSEDTAEIADAQATLNADSADPAAIARQLRAEADAADRGRDQRAG